MKKMLEKFGLVILPVVVLAMLSSPVRAQEERNIFVSLHSGATLVAAPEGIREYWLPRPNFGFRVGYSITPKLALFAAIDYNTFSFNKGKFEDGENFIIQDWYDEEYGYDIRLFNFSGNAKYTLPTVKFMSPYVTAGVGFLRFAVPEYLEACWYDYDPIGGTMPVEHCSSLLRKLESESTIFIQGGAGVDFKLGRVISIFLEGKYALGFTDIKGLGWTHYFPLNLGLTARIK